MDVVYIHHRWFEKGLGLNEGSGPKPERQACRELCPSSLVLTHTKPQRHTKVSVIDTLALDFPSQPKHHVLCLSVFNLGLKKGLLGTLDETSSAGKTEDASAVA